MSDSPTDLEPEPSGQAVLAVVEEAPPQENTRRDAHTRQQNKPPRRQPNYHVIIWNDDEHTYEYVIELLMKLFAHPFEKAFQITHEVDHSGKGIAYTCHMELAELKRDMVLGYGADWRMSTSTGSIRATIEPAPE